MRPLFDATSLELLLANGRNRDQDHAPVIKVFNPTGAQTWLLSELDPYGDTLFGLCDLGFGEPEMGYVSMSELLEVSRRLPIGLERDLYFQGTRPLSVYAGEARAAGRITA
ncbi:DUF2958 domain-containing protein [Methylorubrum extorquens]